MGVREVVCRMRGCPVVVCTHGGKPLPVKVKAFSPPNGTSNDILCKTELSRKMYFPVSIAILRTHTTGQTIRNDWGLPRRGRLSNAAGTLHGDGGFAGDLRLAKAAPCDRNPVFRVLDREDHLVLIFAALLLVVSAFRDCPRRASQRACPACPAGIVKAIGVMIRIGLLRGTQG